MSEREPDFFHKGKDWSAIPVPGTGTMMVLPPDGVKPGDAASPNEVACPWCGFSTVQEAVCDRCGSPLPSERSPFWSLIDAAY
jgi:hypothetical protein